MERLANELLANNGSCTAARILNDQERQSVNERRIATSMNMAVRQRNYRRARDRALARLAQAYPNDYKELLEQEKAIDETQGRKWIDIDGTTNNVAIRSDVASITGVRETGNDGENQGHNGGEA